MEKLHMKFLALNVDFNGQSLDFLRSRKLRTRASNSGILVKVVILPLLASLPWKRLQIGMDMLPSDELFSRINIDDFKKPCTSKIRGFYWFLRFLAAMHTPSLNCDEMAGDRLTVCEQELL